MGFDFLSSVSVQGEEKDRQESKFDAYARDLSAYYENGTNIRMASPDIKYALAMQKERFDKNGISVSHQFTPYPKNSRDGGIFGCHRFDTEKWKVYYDHKIVKHEAVYKKDGRVIGKMKDNRSLLYQYFVDVREEQGVSSEDTVCCPNCGAIHKIGELMSGCKYCGTRFELSTIFPVVTSYFYNCKKNTSIKRTLIGMGVFAVLCGILAAVVLTILQMQWGRNIALILIMDMAVFFSATLFGYMLSGFLFFFWMCIKALIAIPALADTGSAKKKIEQTVKARDHSFAYEYFAGTTQSLLRTVLLSDKPEKLTCFRGKRTPRFRESVLDTVSVGDMSFEGSREKNGFLLLDCGLYMNDIALENGKIKIRPRKYTVGFCRKLNTQTDYGFSIHKVQCKNCSGSFDAVLEKKCTYCGTEYHLEEDDWVIYDIKHVKKLPYYGYMA